MKRDSESRSRRSVTEPLTPNADSTDLPTHVASGLRNRSLLPLAAAAVVALVAGLVLWLGDRPTPVAESPAAKTESGESTAQQTSADKLPEPPLIRQENGDFAVEAAIEADRQRVLAEPRSAAAWGDLGCVLLAHEFKQEAADCFAVAARLDPKDARWPYLGGRAFRLTDPQRTRPLFEQAVAICGNQPAAPRLALAELLLEIFDLDAAEAQINAYLATDRGNPRARLAQARLANLRGQTSECVQQLRELGRFSEQVPELRGRMKPLLLMLSECYRRLGQVDEAEKMRLLADRNSDPVWPDPFYKSVTERRTGLKQQMTEALALFDRKKYDESIALLEQTMGDYPDSIWAKILMGRALIRTGAPDSPNADRDERLRRGEQVLREAWKQDPNSVESIFRLAVAVEYLGRLDESMELYGKAIEIKPDFTMAYHNLAFCHEKKGDVDAAIRSMRTAVEVQPDFLEGLRALGNWLIQQGQYAEAEKYLSSAAKLSPEDATIRMLLGRARQAQRD